MTIINIEEVLPPELYKAFSKEMSDYERDLIRGRVRKLENLREEKAALERLPESISNDFLTIVRAHMDKCKDLINCTVHSEVIMPFFKLRQEREDKISRLQKEIDDFKFETVHSAHPYHQGNRDIVKTKYGLYIVDYDKMETFYDTDVFRNNEKNFSEFTFKEKNELIIKHNGDIEDFLFSKGYVAVGGSDTTQRYQFDKIEAIRIYLDRDDKNYLTAYFASGIHEKLRLGKSRSDGSLGNVLCSGDDRSYGKEYSPWFHIWTYTVDKFSQKVKNEGWTELSEKQTREEIYKYIHRHEI